MVNGDGVSKHANQRVEFRTCQSCPAILNIEQCIVLAWRVQESGRIFRVLVRAGEFPLRHQLLSRNLLSDGVLRCKVSELGSIAVEKMRYAAVSLMTAAETGFGRLMFGVCLQDSEMDMCTKLSVQNRICMKLLCMKCFQRRYMQVYVAKYNMWSVVTECGRSVVKGCLLCFVLWRHVAQQLSFERSADNLLRRGPLFFWPPTLFFWPPPLFFWPPTLFFLTPCFFNTLTLFFWPPATLFFLTRWPCFFDPPPCFLEPPTLFFFDAPPCFFDPPPCFFDPLDLLSEPPWYSLNSLGMVFFPRQVLDFFGFLVLCFPASLLFCRSASLLLCFSAF